MGVLLNVEETALPSGVEEPYHVLALQVAVTVYTVVPIHYYHYIDVICYLRKLSISF